MKLFDILFPANHPAARPLKTKTVTDFLRTTAEFYELDILQTGQFHTLSLEFELPSQTISANLPQVQQCRFDKKHMTVVSKGILSINFIVKALLFSI